MTRSQLNQATEELAGLIKRVGGQALSNSESHYINVPIGNTLTWGVGTSGSGDQTFKLSYGAISNCSCAGTLNFGGRGLPSTQYNLTLEHRGKVQPVVVLLTGKVVIPK
jgi:hypothetical protein